MPLIIHELVTTIETPAESEEQNMQSTGMQDDEKKSVDAVALNREREERLNID